MMPYKEDGHHTIEELFYNKRNTNGAMLVDE
jgi:hypothetical protein